MDDRTYTADAERMSHLQRLQDELARLQQQHAEVVAQWQLCHDALTTAERELDAHRRELVALRDERPRLLAANVRLFHDNNALRAELATAQDNAAELGKALDMCIAERDGAFVRFDEYKASVIEFACRRQDEINALRAELDAMRQAHSVIAARMAAMGC